MAISVMERKNKRGESRWTITVRKSGHTISWTTRLKKPAMAWARGVEDAIDAGTYKRELWLDGGDGQEKTIDPVAGPTRVQRLTASFRETPSIHWTLEHAVEQYIARYLRQSDEKGAHKKEMLLRRWQKHPVAQKSLKEVTPEELQAHVKARLGGKAGMRTGDWSTRPLSANTVRNEIFGLSAVYEYAQQPRNAEGHGWSLMDLANPCKLLVLPPQPPSRSRRLTVAHEVGDGPQATGEEERLRTALGELADNLNPVVMTAVFDLAIETGMRQSELLDVRLGQIRRTRTATVVDREDSKNGDRRQVTMSARARRALDDLIALLPHGYKSPKDSRLIRLNGSQVGYRWTLARRAAGITERLTWHDLRHESLSSMAERGLTIGELRNQSGHRSAQVLLGYVNAKPSEIARKLDRE